jgi:hypothetical protein
VRLQLIARGVVALGALAALAAPARAEQADATATMRVYADDDHVTVVSPAASANASLGAQTRVALDVVVDVVSAASVDVLTSASPGPVRERRVESGVVLTRRLPWGAATTVALGARGSHERDYLALGAHVGARAELAERNTTVEVRYEVERDAVGSVVDAAFARRRVGHRLSVTMSQLLDDRTVLDVIGDGTIATGYHASPYRRVALERLGWPVPLYVDEVTPRARRSVAIAARVRRQVAATWFATSTYRFVVDDWALSSHTATLELRHPLGARFLVGAAVRGYVQGGAAFYRGAYVLDGGAPPPLRTRDRTLGPMRDVAATLTVDRALDADARWHLVLAGGVLAAWFLDNPAQASRRAVTSTLTLAASLP